MPLPHPFARYVLLLLLAAPGLAQDERVVPKRAIKWKPKEYEEAMLHAAAGGGVSGHRLVHDAA